MARDVASFQTVACRTIPAMSWLNKGYPEKDRVLMDKSAEAVENVRVDPFC